MAFKTTFLLKREEKEIQFIKLKSKNADPNKMYIVYAA
jgi:hypothetical protein